MKRFLLLILVPYLIVGMEAKNAGPESMEDPGTAMEQRLAKEPDWIKRTDDAQVAAVKFFIRKCGGCETWMGALGMECTGTVLTYVICAHCGCNPCCCLTGTAAFLCCCLGIETHAVMHSIADQLSGGKETRRRYYRPAGQRIIAAASALNSNGE